MLIEEGVVMNVMVLLREEENEGDENDDHDGIFGWLLDVGPWWRIGFSVLLQRGYGGRLCLGGCHGLLGLGVSVEMEDESGDDMAASGWKQWCVKDQYAWNDLIG
ncbi:hypothetical protein LR48_Vigan08g018900 [Vigna angularis]|uniref:Uncharacterized protein n=1 Tax=Phaseolus angularis TaxID=3914 RepID=A0A0L9V357_PHAAN|nr:hypothetical protein LR48_Vigan08g018900 [Vigna angularis]